MIRVMLVDDHPIVLAGLAALVTSDSDLALIAQSRSASEALVVAPEPDVVLVDLDLPDGDGVELGATLKARWPQTRVVVLTMHADDHAVIRCLSAGLDGYLLKDADPEDLLAAVHTAAGGTMVLGRGATAAVVAAADSTARPEHERLAALDARDLEILALLVAGHSTAQVATRLFLAQKTIRNRVSDMVAKLGVANRDEAISLGRAAGLPRSGNQHVGGIQRR